MGRSGLDRGLLHLRPRRQCCLQRVELLRQHADGHVTSFADISLCNADTTTTAGNTVYVGLGISGQPLSQPYRWAKSGTAILSFCFGTYVFSRLARLLGPLRRSTMCSSFLFQASLCFISGVLVVSDVVPDDAGNRLPGNCIVLLPLGLLSFQSAGQIVASRMLAYNELPTVVLTSTYCDLMLDPALFTASMKETSKRNRRFVSAIALLLGAALGGILTRGGSIADALWIAGIVKVIMAVIWIFWRGEGSIRLE
jgi:Protein of unknown function (DUF1275)